MATTVIAERIRNRKHVGNTQRGQLMQIQSRLSSATWWSDDRRGQKRLSHLYHYAPSVASRSPILGRPLPTFQRDRYSEIRMAFRSDWTDGDLNLKRVKMVSLRYYYHWTMISKSEKSFIGEVLVCSYIIYYLLCYFNKTFERDFG